MSRHALAAESAEKTVQISETEYNSLKAAAELLRHPEVLLYTLSTVGGPRGQSLEEAFSTEVSPGNRTAKRAKSA